MEPHEKVNARLACFLVAASVPIALWLAGAAILRTQSEAALVLRHLGCAVAALLAVALTVAITRSELRAAILMLVGGGLSVPVAVVIALPPIAPRLAPEQLPGHDAPRAAGSGSFALARLP